jgi:hypothetical protein
LQLDYPLLSSIKLCMATNRAAGAIQQGCYVQLPHRPDDEMGGQPNSQPNGSIQLRLRTLLQPLLYFLPRQMHQALAHHIWHSVIVKQHNLVASLIQVLCFALQQISK